VNGKLKVMIIKLRNQLLSYLPLKGLMLRIEGAGDPVIKVNYNVLTVNRTGVGIYVITPVQTTFFGVDIISNSTAVLGFAINPSGCEGSA